MARLISTVLILFALLPFAACAQTATNLTLGHSLLPLYGPWKFHIGDSPLDPSTAKPLWAQPNFDDTSWETVDLTPNHPVDAFSGSGGYQPGWAGKGHPGYSGYAWYRIRLVIHGDPEQKFALAAPRIFDDAYQYFLNGALAGNFGRFDGKRPTFYYAQPMIFPLPHAQEGPQVVAFRMWVSPSTLDMQTDAGGFHLAPLLGTADAVAAEYQLGWLQAVRENAVWALTGLVYSLLAVIAFSLFFLNRTDRVYFWMGALLLVMGVGGIETALAAWTTTISAIAEVWLCNALILPVIGFVWIMLLREWFHLQRPRWLPWLAALLSLAYAFSLAAVLDLLSPLLPYRLAPIFYLPSQVLHLVVGVIITWMIIRGMRRFGVEGWLILPGILLAWVQSMAAFLHIPQAYFPFNVSLTLSQITAFLLATAMCALLVRRWVQATLAQRQVTLEMRQAQEVQQVLIPDAVPQISGFSIQSVYRPAGQVGGDFFQILPAAQGSVLLCIGDVSGKGMPAAMTVSLLVGTLRTLAHYTQRPGEILSAMNQRMQGRSRGGFTTCLVLHATPDGTVTVANAGHIPPYLNAAELSLENGLPLGLVAESTYPEATFQQQANQQITLLTDGVIEARAASGELFGFERTAAIAAQSAESISSAAQAFGQDDDITVLTLTRVPVGQPSSAPQMATVCAPTLA